MAADMVFRLDHDHRGAGLARHDRGRQAGRARADDDHVGFAVPSHCVCHFGVFRLDCGRDTNHEPYSFGNWLDGRSFSFVA